MIAVIGDEPTISSPSPVTLEQHSQIPENLADYVSTGRPTVGGCIWSLQSNPWVRQATGISHRHGVFDVGVPTFASWRSEGVTSEAGVEQQAGVAVSFSVQIGSREDRYASCTDLLPICWRSKRTPSIDSAAKIVTLRFAEKKSPGNGDHNG